MGQDEALHKEVSVHNSNSGPNSMPCSHDVDDDTRILCSGSLNGKAIPYRGHHPGERGPGGHRVAVEGSWDHP